jgi:hypothetical protein
LDSWSSSFARLDSKWEILQCQHLLAIQLRDFELSMKNGMIDNKHRLDLTTRGSSDFNEVELHLEKQV